MPRRQFADKVCGEHMNDKQLREIFESVKTGEFDIQQAIEKLRWLPFEAIEFARVDHHRTIRCGFPEVIYCPGKTNEQVVAIFKHLAESGNSVLATRATQANYDAVAEAFPDAIYHETGRMITLHRGERAEPLGHIAVVAAGTSDLTVAEEACVTAETFDQRVTRHFDVGVAGLHRLLACGEDLQSANVIVAVAGMEGALASVVAGLVAVPVIAVPTSVGYGASFGGLAALLAMLNSCASNVCVVNIDNGFTAGYVASMINRQTTAVQG